MTHPYAQYALSYLTSWVSSNMYGASRRDVTVLRSGGWYTVEARYDGRVEARGCGSTLAIALENARHVLEKREKALREEHI